VRVHKSCLSDGAEKRIPFSCRSSTAAAPPTVDGTTWNYTIYIARSQGERDCWGDMFSDRAGVNPSLPNVRQGWADIFSGGPGTAQRTHLLAMARRLANRGEKIYATPQSPASTSSPSTLTFEGTFSYDDVLNAWQLP